VIVEQRAVVKYIHEGESAKLYSPYQRAKPAAGMTKTRPKAEVCIVSTESTSRFLHRAENESVSGQAKNRHPHPTKSLRCHSDFLSVRSSFREFRMHRKSECSTLTTDFALVS
jgi:hypothetical protein